MTKLLRLLAFLGVPVLALAQLTTTQTTFSSAPGATDLFVCLASATGVTVPSIGANGTYIFATTELMQVTGAGSSATCFTVQRGMSPTGQFAHTTSETVWIGNAATSSGDSSRPFTGGPFISNIPPGGGTCKGSAQYTLPLIVAFNVLGKEAGQLGEVWDCPSTGPAANTWTLRSSPSSTFQLTDGTFLVPPSACVGATTGTAGTGNNTLILDGAVAALKISATAAGASVNTFSCTFTVPQERLTSGKGITLNSADFMYSVQTTTATSQTLSTFKSFTAPTAAASETASSATLVAAGGTITQVPAVGSANLTAVSAGQYYTSRASFGTPVNVTTALQTFVLTFVISQSASAAQIVTTPGFYINYTNVPL